jgi:hypothetical protein
MRLIDDLKLLMVACYRVTPSSVNQLTFKSGQKDTK